MIMPIWKSLNPSPPASRPAERNRAAIGSQRPYTAYCRNIITYRRGSTRECAAAIGPWVVTAQTIP
jgi:hypothetical protein